MNNLVSFLSDSRLTQDIACLLTFLQQSFNQDNFFKAFPNAILKATLDELKFDFDNEKTLSITLKNDLKKRNLMFLIHCLALSDFLQINSQKSYNTTNF